MRTRLPSLSALRAFEAAARLQSFKQAADELNVTATAISHRIRVLEEELSCALFIRKVRTVELTTNGRLLYSAVRDGFDAIAAGIDSIRQADRAAVTLSTTPAFATKWLVPRLAAFQAEHPDIDLHVHASNLPVDLQHGNVDLAIRYGHGQYPDLHAQLLLQDQFAPVVSPKLRQTPDDIFSLPLIHFAWQRTSPRVLDWAAWARAAGRADLDMLGGVRYSEESHAIQAAVAGQGVALLSLVLVQEELALGLLKRCDTHALQGLSYYVVRSRHKPLSPACAAVESWLLSVSQLMSD